MTEDVLSDAEWERVHAAAVEAERRPDPAQLNWIAMTEPRFEVVPKGTKASVCTGHRKPGGSCRAAIYWIERPRAGGKPGKARVPVDCDVEGGSAPDSLSDGRGVSHFGTCPDADQF